MNISSSVNFGVESQSCRHSGHQVLPCDLYFGPGWRNWSCSSRRGHFARDLDTETSLNTLRWHLSAWPPPFPIQRCPPRWTQLNQVKFLEQKTWICWCSKWNSHHHCKRDGVFFTVLQLGEKLGVLLVAVLSPVVQKWGTLSHSPSFLYHDRKYLMSAAQSSSTSFILSSISCFWALTT